MVFSIRSLEHRIPPILNDLIQIAHLVIVISKIIILLKIIECVIIKNTIECIQKFENAKTIHKINLKIYTIFIYDSDSSSRVGIGICTFDSSFNFSVNSRSRCSSNRNDPGAYNSLVAELYANSLIHVASS